MTEFLATSRRFCPRGKWLVLLTLSQPLIPPPSITFWIWFWGHHLFLFQSVVTQMVKNRPAMRETRVRSLHWEDPLEESMATHFSILAWRIPWTEEPGGLQSMGSQRAGQGWATKHILKHPILQVTIFQFPLLVSPHPQSLKYSALRLLLHLYSSPKWSHLGPLFYNF